MPTVDRATANRIAHQWIEAWNAHDAKAVVAHFAEDVSASSPLIEERRPGSGGILRGRERVLSYYEEGLVLAPDLRFELMGVLCGVNRITIVYRTHVGALVAETLVIDAQGVVSAVEVSRGERGAVGSWPP